MLPFNGQDVVVDDQLVWQEVQEVVDMQPSAFSWGSHSALTTTDSKCQNFQEAQSQNFFVFRTRFQTGSSLKTKI